MKVPEVVGVPLIVIILFDHKAETPVGKPFAPLTPLLEIPVATVVEWVILVKVVFTHPVTVKEAVPTVKRFAFTARRVLLSTVPTVCEA